MKRSGKAARMKEDNPTCFKESKIGEAGVYLSEGSSISDKSWVVDSRTSFVNYSEIGDNIFYLDSGFIMEENSKFNGSLFSRGGESNLRLLSTSIDANVNILGECYITLSNSNIEGNFVVRGEGGRLNCVNVNILGNVIIELPKNSSIDLVNVEIHGDLILDSVSYLRMGECSVFGYNTIVKKGIGDLRMEKCHYNNSGYNEYNLTTDTVWKEKIEGSKHI